MNETADELLRAVVAIAQLPMERWAGAFLFIIGELRAIAQAQDAGFDLVLDELHDALYVYEPSEELTKIA